MLGALVLNLLAALIPGTWRPFWIVMLTLQGLFYLLAFAGDKLANRGKKSKLLRLLYLPTFLLNSNLAALQGMVKFLRGGQYHIWERIKRG
jgi:hypothetical protein